MFVHEQGVPVDEEMDAHDATAVHVLALWDGNPVGTARAVSKDPGVQKIGRVAVAAKFRKHGIGKALMRGIEAQCPAGSAFVLAAQSRVTGFYEKLGYEAEGPEFLDAGIPHRLMRKPASAP